MTERELPILCPYGKFGRKMGGAVAAGLVYWCKEHRTTHLKTWQEIDDIRREVTGVPATSGENPANCEQTL